MTVPAKNSREGIFAGEVACFTDSILDFPSNDEVVFSWQAERRFTIRTR
jgi:hypothetical protein